MADKRELDDLRDEFLGLFQSVLSRRALVISWFYFFGCLIFGIGFWKSCAVWLASYVPMVLPVGRKYIEQLGIVPLGQVIILGRDLLAAMGGAMFIKQRIAIVEWAEDHENLFDDRAVIVLALYFLGAITFGVAAWKAVVIGAAAYGLVLMRIGPRPIAVLGVLFFLMALTEWSGLGDIRQCFKG